MGMSGPANANKVARRNRWSGRAGLMSEINVTPFVDVMLVLLIIFMVAAPLLTVGVPVDLPETGAKALETRSTPIIVSVDREGRVHLQETPIPLENIVSKLRSIAATGYEERIFIRGDKSTHYGIVMKVMAEISAAGFKNIGLISLPEKGL